MNKGFRKSTSIILASLMAFSFTAVACNNSNQQTESASETSEDLSQDSTTPVAAHTGDENPLQTKSLKDLAAPGDPTNIPETLQIDWSKRYRYSELEEQLAAISKEAADITELYSIGTSWQERKLWCLEITNKSIPTEQKTGIGLFAAIHGEEREAASSAMYDAWWMVLNRDDEYIKTMMDQYIIYIIPVINPDGYEQSFVYGNRSNLRPTDLNNDGVPFSDPYADIDGDGFIASIYKGSADTEPVSMLSTDWTRPELNRFGMESPDWDQNGILGDDPRSSGIDMNRNFNHQWNRFDIETVDTQVIGANSWHRAGPDAASEPEVRAIQNFLAQKPMNALVTIHTGIQAVYYPWCYRPYDANNPADADLTYMKDISAKMADILCKTTGRGFFSMASYDDYATNSEMIDYAYENFNIHAYTLEVYCGGKSGDINDHLWENELPEEKWVFYSQDDIKNKLGMEPTTLKSSFDGKPLASNEGLWFYTSSDAQMLDVAPEDQELMVKGARDAVLVMIENEPYGEGYKSPFFLK